MTLKLVTAYEHQEEFWKIVIQAIPKNWQSHRKVVRYFLERYQNNTKVSRVLDIGAGEGTFTETALEILLHAKAISSELHIDLVEGYDKHYKLLDERMKNLQIRFKEEGISLSYSIRCPMTIPPTHNEMDSFFKNILMTNNLDTHGYDVIIASHVTYYFPDGGAGLCQALVDSALRTGGTAWFVVRSMKGSLYHVRANLLKKHNIPNSEAHQFAEHFIIASQCMFKDIVVIPRTLTLNFNKVENFCKDAIGYLTWLKDISSEEFEELKKARVFHESHAFIPKQTCQFEQDKHNEMLFAASTIASAVNTIRSICPDVNVVRATLASIFRDDKKITMIRYGFSSKQESHDDANTYLKQNPSFLQYEEFFLDNISLLQDSGSYPYFIRGIGKPTQTTSKYGLESYSVHKGNPEPYGFREKSVELQTLYDNWVKILKNIYSCTSEETKNPTYFSCDIGARVGAFWNLEKNIIEDEVVTGACGLFLLLSSKNNIEAKSHYFWGHVKATLSQYLAQLLFAKNLEQQEKTKRQNEQLKQIENAMALMQIPLREITTSIRDVQVQTQYLRSVLYAPERSLFEAHSAVSVFFTQGNLVRIGQCPPIIIQHEPFRYVADSHIVPALIWTILAQCFGIICASMSVRNIKKIPKYIYDQLKNSKRFQQGSMEQEFSAFCFMCGSDLLKGDNKWAALLELEIGDAVVILERIKQTLYTPFKIGEQHWPIRALKLALLSAQPSNSEIEYVFNHRPVTNFDKIILANAAYTPIPYNAILELIMNLYDLIKTRSMGEEHCVRAVRLFNSGEDIEQLIAIEIDFEGANIIDNAGIMMTRKLLHDLVLKAPRDWRIEDAHGGDSTTPFINLASRCIGIVDPSSKRGRWKSIRRKIKDEITILLLENIEESGREFSVQVKNNSEKKISSLIIHLKNTKQG